MLESFRTRGRGYSSEGDGIVYTYSVFGSIPKLAEWVDTVSVIPTVPRRNASQSSSRQPGICRSQLQISSERIIVSQSSSYLLSRRRIRLSPSLGGGGPRCPNSPSTDPRMIAEAFRDFSRSYKMDLTKLPAMLRQCSRK